MADDFFRVRLGIASRADGHSAAKRSAYQSCCVRTDHEGRRFDWSSKVAEHRGTHMILPAGAPAWAADPGELWRQAAALEKRVDAQEARILDWSMPRQIPRKLWEPCIRHVYEPFRMHGMAFQVDVHDSPARDGGRNVNVHGLGTLRRFDGDGFSKKKAREWNELFRDGDRKGVRKLVADRLNDFCRQHGIDYQADHRSNSERCLPAPEPQLPVWNFKHEQDTGNKTPAVLDLESHRQRRRDWTRAHDEARAAEAEVVSLENYHRQVARRGIASADPGRRKAERRDWKAGVLRTWRDQVRGKNAAGDWLPADAAGRIAWARIDNDRDCLWISLKDGSCLIDTGNSVRLSGKLTWDAAFETAAAAERHGWKQAVVSGDQAYKDAVSIACALRGITVTNHKLSPKAQAQLDRLRAKQEARQGPVAAAPGVQPERPDSAKEWEKIQALRRRAAQEEPEPPRKPSQVPAYLPPWAKRPDVAARERAREKQRERR